MDVTVKKLILKGQYKMFSISKIIKKLLKIHSPSKNLHEYHEKDTKCDLCKNKDICEPNLIDITCSYDTRIHVINCPGYICPWDKIGGRE